jgi:hypothetical protein
MSLSNVHPDYSRFADGWRTLRDFYAGEAVVKAAGFRYLPATAGMILDGITATTQLGWQNYCAYRDRAVVPDYVREGVEILVGLLHQKDATIELPEQMEYMRAQATSDGEPLAALHRRINVEQLCIGRLGLLTDLPTNPDPLKPEPYIALYAGEAIKNWDCGSTTEGVNSIDMVVLNESGSVRMNTFEWKDVEKYRVLMLVEEDGKVIYKQGLFSDETSLTFDLEQMQAPTLRGKVLDHIPFTFINTKDLLPRPDEPPLAGLASVCKTIYQGEADYRQNLFMQGQDTLVVIGGIRNATGIPGEPEALRVGAGTRIDCDTGGDAKYIGVTNQGLSEQRTALENDRKRAQIKAGELVQSAGSQQESGVALSTRFTAQTATLNHIALSGAAGLELALKNIAMWIGADPGKVKVTPNLEFIDFGLDGQNFVDIMTARSMGFPISIESLHAIAADRGLTIIDFMTEMKRIEEENKTLEKILPSAPAPGAAPAVGPAGAKPPAKAAKKAPAKAPKKA